MDEGSDEHLDQHINEVERELEREAEHELEHDELQPHRSGGPRTPEGKAISSQNSVTHGCCSHIVLLPGENQQDLDDLYNRWIDAFQPDSTAAFELIEELVLSKWFLLRNERRYSEVEQHLAPFPFITWTPEQHKEYQLVLRYRTAAERSANKALREVEDYFKNRRAEDTHRSRIWYNSFKSYRDFSRGMHTALNTYRKQIAHRQAHGLDFSEQQAALDDVETKHRAAFDRIANELATLDPLKVLAEIPSPAHTSPKRFPITPFIEQFARIEVENEEPVIKLHPSNRTLIADAQAMHPPPEIVYRRLEFIRTVPDEYPWVTTDPVIRKLGGFKVQRFPFADWLQLIEFEEGDPNGPLRPGLFR
jgi:hypothetical protein